MPSVELIFAEFRFMDNRRLEDLCQPALGSFKRWFPEATYRIISERTHPIPKELDESNYRIGNRLNDYYQAIGLLTSEADIAIALDADLLVVNRRVRTILYLAKVFGVCLPMNARHFVWRDARSPEDGGPTFGRGFVSDACEGMGASHATAFIALNKENEQARKLIEEYARQLLESPCRGPLAFWRAECRNRYHAYTLPPEWCLTGNMLAHHDDPVILHVGHETVREKFKDLIKDFA